MDKDKGKKHPLLNKLEKAVEKKELPPGFRLEYLISGGHAHAFRQGVAFDADGNVQYEFRDPKHDLYAPETHTQVDQQQLLQMMRILLEGAKGLVQAPEAAFIPDALVGRIKIRIDAQETTLYFNPSPEAQLPKKSGWEYTRSPEMADVRVAYNEFIKQLSQS